MARNRMDADESTDQAQGEDASSNPTSHPAQAPAADNMVMMRQMFEFMSTAQRQNQEQMAQMLQQQVLLQQQMLQAHVVAQKPQKKTGKPPQFNGQANEDLELWLFSTEQYYSSYSEEMQSDSSDLATPSSRTSAPRHKPANS
ncbi:Hypothetical protein PHPALM_9423 [Phytophthora palmivora]|uniref:Uncharacterized protein n=1 Tax=Phytophthora palmivora TaxID=4796 RepID=A0A2P4Y7C9_9STRA|nr:Hypothetical protein PHPALM_9423 [Phytophthora palmivora]